MSLDTSITLERIREIREEHDRIIEEQHRRLAAVVLRGREEGWTMEELASAAGRTRANLYIFVERWG